MHEDPADPLTRLSAFTAAAGIDRDQLLFEAGKAAAAKPARPWKALAGLLAATQVMSLGLMMRPRPASDVIPQTSELFVKDIRQDAPPTSDDSSYAVLRNAAGESRSSTGDYPPDSETVLTARAPFDSIFEN